MRPRSCLWLVCTAGADCGLLGAFYTSTNTTMLGCARLSPGCPLISLVAELLTVGERSSVRPCSGKRKASLRSKLERTRTGRLTASPEATPDPSTPKAGSSRARPTKARTAS